MSKTVSREGCLWNQWAEARGRIDALKTKCAQVEFIDENIEHADWIFFDYVIVQALRQQRNFTLNESPQDRPRYDLDDQKVRQSLAFSHSLDPKETVDLCARFNPK